MARLKPCRDCGRMVSPRADACPWCRKTKPAQSLFRRHPFIGILVLGILLYGAISVFATTAVAGSRLLSALIA